MLTPDIRQALEAELEHLQMKRQNLVSALDRKIAGLKAFLDTPDDVGAQQALPLAGLTTSSAVAVAGYDPSKNVGSLSPMSGKGTRKAILDVLALSPKKGLRPVEVASRLEEMGWHPTGSTPLSRLIPTELYRMRNAGKVVKKGKRYFPAEPGGDAPTAA